MITKNGAILLGVSLASALLGYYLSKSTTQTRSSYSSDLSTVESSPVQASNRQFTVAPPDVNNLVVVTRIHQQEASNMTEIDKVVSFVKSSLQYASKVFVCTGQTSRGNNLYWNELKTKLLELGECIHASCVVSYIAYVTFYL